jgi:hypothetical protein
LARFVIVSTQLPPQALSPPSQKIEASTEPPLDPASACPPLLVVWPLLLAV